MEGGATLLSDNIFSDWLDNHKTDLSISAMATPTYPTDLMTHPMCTQQEVPQMIIQLAFPQFPAYYNIDWATAENKVLHDAHTVLHSVLPMYQDPNQYE